MTDEQEVAAATWLWLVAIPTFCRHIKELPASIDDERGMTHAMHECAEYAFGRTPGMRSKRTDLVRDCMVASGLHRLSLVADRSLRIRLGVAAVWRYLLGEIGSCDRAGGDYERTREELISTSYRMRDSLNETLPSLGVS